LGYGETGHAGPLFADVTLKQAISVLQAREAELCGRGVRRAAIFGSVARGDTRAESDVDILVDLDPDSGLDVFAYVGCLGPLLAVMKDELRHP
jgi:hypothetical protein